MNLMLFGARDELSEQALDHGARPQTTELSRHQRLRVLHTVAARLLYLICINALGVNLDRRPAEHGIPLRGMRRALAPLGRGGARADGQQPRDDRLICIDLHTSCTHGEIKQMLEEKSFVQVGHVNHVRQQTHGRGGVH